MGGETAYTYDDLGQITSVTNALGNTSTTQYDPDGRPVKESNALASGDSDTHRVSYTYDKMGRVVKKTNEDGSTVTYAYDKTAM